MRTRLEPWRHRLLAVVGAAPLICCGGSFEGSDDDNGNAGSTGKGGTSTNGGATSGKGGATSGKGGATSGKGGSDSGGSTSTGGSTGMGGEAGTVMVGGGSNGSSFPCVNPTPLDPNYDSGYEVCDGFIHRPVITECHLGLPRPDSWEPTEFDTCTSDADCVDAAYGYCNYPAGGQIPGRVCEYGCIKDSECGAGSVCVCGTPVGRCQPATCTSDADCGGDFLCSTYSDITCGYAGFACQTPADTCGGNSDCGFNYCELLESGQRQCSMTGCLAIGRPFLVASEARLAAEARRGDWLAEIAAPSVAALSLEERSQLAAFWTRAGLMEHASIAAFARFTLGLLALGAPAELVQAGSAASADETRHAEVCFALASTYAGKATGPGPLEVRGALDDLTLATLLTTTIREGCAGETLAAIEASEQAAHASDPVVKRLLSAIAEDETRHAELAWRFVAWALERGGAELKQLARAEFQRCLLEDVALEPTVGLERHGVLSTNARLELRQRALREVVMPCARALLGSGTPPEPDAGRAGEQAETAPA